MPAHKPFNSGQPWTYVDTMEAVRIHRAHTKGELPDAVRASADYMGRGLVETFDRARTATRWVELGETVDDLIKVEEHMRLAELVSKRRDIWKMRGLDDRSW